MAWIRSQNKKMLVKITGVYQSGVNIYALPEPQDYVIGTFIRENDVIYEIDAICRWLERGGSGVYHINKETHYD